MKPKVICLNGSGNVIEKVHNNDIYLIPFSDHSFNFGEHKLVFHLKDNKNVVFFYTEDSNIRTIPVKNMFMSHTSI